MPNLTQIADTVTLNIGTFVKGRWDYIMLVQLYPKLEAIAQLVPRKEPATNYEATILYQTETQDTGHGAKPGDPVQPTQQSKALRRKVKVVKEVDSLGWTEDQDTLQGKSDEHIAKQIQMDLTAFDLKFWERLEHYLLRMPASTTPDDDDYPFGFPAWLTSKSGAGANEFDLYGGQNPYNDGRPGSISVATYPKFTNPTASFQAVSDDDFFDKLEEFLIRRKLMGVVPNPRLLPDTPNDVGYFNAKVVKAIQRYLTASNENFGMDAGRYRGASSYKGIPFVVWHAADHPDSPVADATCIGRVIDWNSFRYSVVPSYDRKITGPKDVPLVPDMVYITSQLWHQITCDRPDRNLYMQSATAAFQP